MKLLIIGHGGHGKDTLAEIWAEGFGMTYKSSSEAAAEIFIFDALRYKGYTSAKECYEDRRNHRAEWYELICNYNRHDKALLAKQILLTNDCYVGMRNREEIQECLRQGIFDLIVWVDASKRLPLEDESSFNIDLSCADVIIDNNGTEDDLRHRAVRLGNLLTWR